MAVRKKRDWLWMFYWSETAAAPEVSTINPGISKSPPTDETQPSPPFSPTLHSNPVTPSANSLSLAFCLIPPPHSALKSNPHYIPNYCAPTPQTSGLSSWLILASPPSKSLLSPSGGVKALARSIQGPTSLFHSRAKAHFGLVLKYVFLRLQFYKNRIHIFLLTHVWRGARLQRTQQLSFFLHAGGKSVNSHSNGMMCYWSLWGNSLLPMGGQGPGSAEDQCSGVDKNESSQRTKDVLRYWYHSQSKDF